MIYAIRAYTAATNEDIFSAQYAPSASDQTWPQLQHVPQTLSRVLLVGEYRFHCVLANTGDRAGDAKQAKCPMPYFSGTDTPMRYRVWKGECVVNLQIPLDPAQYALEATFARVIAGQVTCTLETTGKETGVEATL